MKDVQRHACGIFRLLPKIVFQTEGLSSVIFENCCSIYLSTIFIDFYMDEFVEVNKIEFLIRG